MYFINSIKAKWFLWFFKILIYCMSIRSLLVGKIRTLSRDLVSVHILYKKKIKITLILLRSSGNKLQSTGNKTEDLKELNVLKTLLSLLYQFRSKPDTVSEPVTCVLLLCRAMCSQWAMIMWRRY